jgi:hypothetical protein
MWWLVNRGGKRPSVTGYLGLFFTLCSLYQFVLSHDVCICRVLVMFKAHDRNNFVTTGKALVVLS